MSYELKYIHLNIRKLFNLRLITMLPYNIYDCINPLLEENPYFLRECFLREYFSLEYFSLEYFSNEIIMSVVTVHIELFLNICCFSSMCVTLEYCHSGVLSLWSTVTLEFFLFLVFCCILQIYSKKKNDKMMNFFLIILGENTEIPIRKSTT